MWSVFPAAVDSTDLCNALFDGGGGGRREDRSADDGDADIDTDTDSADLKSGMRNILVPPDTELPIAFASNSTSAAAGDSATAGERTSLLGLLP